MSYYDDYFFGEPTEFDEQIAELKKALTSAVKKEFLDKMDALRKENESLREFRDNKRAYDRELERLEEQYERKMRDAEREANKKKLKDLLALFSVTGYRVDYKFKQRTKCDKCDKYRKIHFTSPSGRKMTEDCSCAKGTRHYFPKEVSLISFNAGKKLDNVYFELISQNDYCDRYDLCADLYDQNKGIKYENINKVRVVFPQKEDCQAYCDWLNEREKEKGGNNA